jgi:hypothetical protein
MLHGDWLKALCGCPRVGRWQEPRGVQDERKLRGDVDEVGQKRAKKPHRGEPNIEEIDCRRTYEVLSDDGPCAARHGEGVDEAREINAEQHDVGALTRDFRSRAHADADVGRREGGGIIDAITDHGHRASISLIPMRRRAAMAAQASTARSRR